MWWPLQLGPGAASPTACPVGPEGVEGLAGWQDPRPPECAQHSGPEAPGQSLAGPAGPAWIPACSSQGGPPAAPSPTQPRPAHSPLPHAAPPRTQLPSLTLPLGLSLSSLCSVKEQQQGQGRGLPQGPRGPCGLGLRVHVDPASPGPQSWLQIKTIKPRAILASGVQTMFPFSPATPGGGGAGRLCPRREQHGTSAAPGLRARAGAPGHPHVPLSWW